MAEPMTPASQAASTAPAKPAAAGTPARGLPDPGLCRLDALTGWLANMDLPALRELLRSSPKRFGDKALRLSHERLLAKAIAALGHDGFRRFVEDDIRLRAGGPVRRLIHDPAGAARELAGLGVPGTAIIGFALLLSPDDATARAAWRALPKAARDAARERERGDLAVVAERIERWRAEREGWAERSADRTARRLAEQMAAPWRWQAERAAMKLERGTSRLAAEVARLKQALDAAAARIKELEEERDDLRAVVADLGRALREEMARTATADAPAGRADAGEKPLGGERVVVIGDEAHAPEYRAIVEGMGGEFAFQPGFDRLGALPDRLEWATACVLVTAYASHKAWDHVKAAENRGLRVILVDRAGADAFRRALDGATAGVRRETRGAPALN